jgi:hypothetical protein
MKIKALRTITDQGQNLSPGTSADVPDHIAAEWIALGWAAAAPEKAARATNAARP